MKKLSLLMFLLSMCLFNNILATEVPSPVRGQFYPIYLNWMDPTTVQVPMNKVNVTFASFAHAYTLSDGSIHWSVPGGTGSLTPPASNSNAILGYENARGSNSQNQPIIPNDGDYDYNRIQKIVNAAHATEGNKVLISLGWNSSGIDWQKINNDLNSSNPQFVKSVVEFIQVNNLDGFDIDWESVSQISQNNINTLFQQLRTALGSNYILSISPANSSMLNKTNLINFDIVNFQSYYSNYSSYYNMFKAYISPSVMTMGTCEDQGYTSDPEGAVSACQKYEAAGVFNWTIQDEQGTWTTVNYFYSNLQ